MNYLLVAAILAVSTLTIAEDDDWKSLGEQIYIQKGCIGCHGVAGVGTAYAPPLVGLSAEYIIEQLTDFQDGTRMNLTMEVMAGQVRGLEGIIAAYLASRIAFIPKEK